MNQYSWSIQSDIAATAEKGGFGIFSNNFERWRHIFIGESLSGPLGNYYDLIAQNDSNTLIVGGTGAGKTLSVAITNIMARGTSFMVIDPKGEIALVLISYLHSQGYEVSVFDPFGVSGLKSSSYDPLAYLDPSDSENLADKINQLLSALLVPPKGSDGDHWVDAAKDLLAGVIAYVVITSNKENSDKESSLLSAHKILQGGVRSIISIAKEVCEKFPETLAYYKLARCAEWDTSNKEAQSILSTLLVQLQFLDSEPIQRSLKKGDFQFSKFLDPNKKNAVFVILPPDKLQSHNKYHRLMINEMISTIASGGVNSSNIIDLYIDEAGTIGKLPILSDAVAHMRGFGLRIWTFYQTLGQIKRNCPEGWGTIIGNAGTILLLKVMDNETAEYFSQRIGCEIQESFQTGSLFKTCGHINRGHGFYTYTEKRILYPEELCQLPDNIGVVITDGPPAFFVKAPYYKTAPFCEALGLV